MRRISITQAVNWLSRRDVIRGIGASAFFATAGHRAHGAEYHQADTSWLANCSFGVSSHWTASSQPVGEDDWVPFEDAVSRFDVSRYVDRIADAGAQYIIFTTTHAKQMLPAPCAAIDRIAPGRTTKRDLLQDLADACHSRQLRFIGYYNHSCNHGDDPDWEYAVGYHAKDKSRLVSNLTGILSELGTRYGSKLDAWWFDSCPALDPRGVYDAVSTDMHGFQFPWEEWTAAAKAGYDARLVTLSSAMLTHFLYSTHQDYEAGEANDLVAVPSSQFTPDHLQAHRWVCLDNPEWIHYRVMTPLAPPRFRLDSVAQYVSTCNKSKVPVTFNIDTDRTGLMSQESLALLHKVKSQIA
jgi:hypothetical protein